MSDASRHLQPDRLISRILFSFIPPCGLIWIDSELGSRWGFIAGPNGCTGMMWSLKITNQSMFDFVGPKVPHSLPRGVSRPMVYHFGFRDLHWLNRVEDQHEGDLHLFCNVVPDHTWHIPPELLSTILGSDILPLNAALGNLSDSTYVSLKCSCISFFRTGIRSSLRQPLYPHSSRR